MSFRPFRIDPDIARAHTPPPELYRDEDWYQKQCDSLFTRSWQMAPISRDALASGDHIPWTLLPGALDEPLLFATDETGRRRCLSNVCTHRGMPLLREQTSAKSLRCPYHGRCFALDGRFQSSPEFAASEDFPSEEDDLPKATYGEWQGFAFAGLQPKLSFEDWLEPLRRPLAPWLTGDWAGTPDSTRHYDVAASWALYIENALEGFHLPWVHPGLSKAIDFATYRSELFASGSIQIAQASENQLAFELPKKHPDCGQRIAGYFVFLFPNTMLNFYPWGLSINLVHPQGKDRCRVTYTTYVNDPDLYGQGAGSDLDAVEREDDAAVEAVQRGMRSRLFRPGRYSVTREQGVHQFHRLLAEYLCGREPMPRVMDT